MIIDEGCFDPELLKLVNGIEKFVPSRSPSPIRNYKKADLVDKDGNINYDVDS